MDALLHSCSRWPGDACPRWCRGTPQCIAQTGSWALAPFDLVQLGPLLWAAAGRGVACNLWLGVPRRLRSGRCLADSPSAVHRGQPAGRACFPGKAAVSRPGTSSETGVSVASVQLLDQACAHRLRESSVCAYGRPRMRVQTHTCTRTAWRCTRVHTRLMRVCAGQAVSLL